MSNTECGNFLKAYKQCQNESGVLDTLKNKCYPLRRELDKCKLELREAKRVASRDRGYTMNDKMRKFLSERTNKEQ